MQKILKAIGTKFGMVLAGKICGRIVIYQDCSKNMILGPSGQNIYPEELEDKLNSMPCVVESIVLSRDGKLVGLVFPDTSTEGKKILGTKSLTQQMEENRVAVNKNLPQYSQISAIELVAQEFEKTPKRSIKRYLYK